MRLATTRLSDSDRNVTVAMKRRGEAGPGSADRTSESISAFDSGTVHHKGNWNVRAGQRTNETGDR